MRSVLNHRFNLAMREALFRLTCRHRQGSRPNILLHCAPRSGSTWLLNTLAAHPGMRYVGRPFQTALRSRWRRQLPDLHQAAQYEGDYLLWVYLQFEGEQERRFRAFACRVIDAEIAIYPTLKFNAPYFHRQTDRIVFQITHATAMAEWFDEQFDVATMVQVRHPIANALSVQALGWQHECRDFLYHQPFCETHLTGTQIDFAWNVVRNGSDLAKLVLDNTLRVLLPIRAWESGQHPDWLLLTYEQMVTDPDGIIAHLSDAFDLTDTEAMRRQSRQPSRTVTATTVAHRHEPSYLLDRWRKDISPAEERDLLAIPSALGLDLYPLGQSMPRDGYLLGAPETRRAAA